MWFKSANMLLFSFTLRSGYCTWPEIFQFLLFFSFTFFLSTADRRLSGRTRALSVDYGQIKNGTRLFFSHTPAPCRYSNLLPPLTTPLWSMELKQGGWEGPSVPIFDPTGAVLNLEAYILLGSKPDILHSIMTKYTSGIGGGGVSNPSKWLLKWMDDILNM